MTSSVLARAKRAALLSLLGCCGPRAALGDSPRAVGQAAPDTVELPRIPPARTARSRAGYQHWVGGVQMGKGVRFNNPYRLRTVLGDDPESLSLSATYLAVHVGRTFSDPDGFEHGVAAHLSIATDGIRQEVLTPSYLLLRRFGPRVLGYGRAGLPIVLEPDAAVGLEAGVGCAYFLSASLGLSAELDVSLFYGAATIERAATLIPLTSLALGIMFDWEVLP